MGCKKQKKTISSSSAGHSSCFSRHRAFLGGTKKVSMHRRMRKKGKGYGQYGISVGNYCASCAEWVAQIAEIAAQVSINIVELTRCRKSQMPVNMWEPTIICVLEFRFPCTVYVIIIFYISIPKYLLYRYEGFNSTLIRILKWNRLNH